MANMSAAHSALDRFQKAARIATPRIIGASSGEPGSGKTHFWLTAPGPIVIQSFDKGLEGVVEPFVEQGKDVRVAEYDWAPTDETFSQEQAVELREKFIEDFLVACANARTVVWDTESMVWELFRYAEFGGPSDNPSNFSALNQRMRKYVNHPKSLTINFGCVQHLKDEWVSVQKANGKTGGASSGQRKRAGFKELEGLVHVDLFHERIGGQFQTTIGKGRGPGAREVHDKTIQNLDFPMLGMMLFPDTEQEDWQ